MSRMFATALILLSLAACETVGGFGKDVENAGDSITDTSNEVQSEM